MPNFVRIPADGSANYTYHFVELVRTSNGTLAPKLPLKEDNGKLGPNVRTASLLGTYSATQTEKSICIRVFYSKEGNAGNENLPKNRKVRGAVGDVYVGKLLKTEAGGSYSHGDVLGWEKDDPMGHMEKIMNALYASGVPIVESDQWGRRVVDQAVQYQECRWQEQHRSV